MIKFNPDSHDHLSLLLFGGILQDEGREVTGYTKTGLEKSRKCKIPLKIKGLGLQPHKDWITKKDGFYQTNEEILFKISQGKNADAAELAKLFLKMRYLEKQISTYYEGVEKRIYITDECIHPQFIHVETDTGRLSSKNPNIQNQPKSIDSEVKKHFISRYKNGKIMEIDYKQLEIVIQAAISGDSQYIKDILDGVDFHTKRLAMKEGLDYEIVKQKIITNVQVWVDKRSKIKEFSFSRAYGAGPRTIAQKTGMKEEEISELIAQEELDYSTLADFYKKLEKLVHKRSKNGWSFYKGPTKRIYLFKKNDWNRYSIPQIKNYIIQGTASDIVMAVLGKSFKDIIKHRDKFLLINTVHDSYIFDVRPEFVDFTRQYIQNVLYLNLKAVLKEFNLNWEVPIDFDIKVGNSWYDCK